MRVNRREFLAGASAFAIAGWREVALAAGYPEYYGEHLAKVSARVAELAKTCPGGCWFITDPHVKSNRCKSGLLLAELVKRTPIAKVLCGGDLTEAFGKGYPTDRDAVDFAIDKYDECWVKPIRAAGGRVYTARGNHDFTVCHSFDSAEDKRHGFTYGGKKSHELIIDRFTEKGVAVNGADPESCYYYFDEAAEKLRYVVADTTDTLKEGDVPWGVRYGVHERQLAWLAGEALAKIPEGYEVVMMYHIPVTGVVGIANDPTMRDLRRLIEAFQNRARYEIGGKTFDFASAKARILVCLTGHEHCEAQTYQKGTLHITNPCDAAYGDYTLRTSPWCKFPKKTAGTIAEQTFDAVQFDPVNRLVHFTRVGGGYDRSIHLDAKTVKVGGKTRLSSTLLKGPVKWACYDADRVSDAPTTNRYVHSMKFHNDFATIGDDGNLTALKPGESVALAMDGELNKEMYPITIV